MGRLKNLEELFIDVLNDRKFPFVNQLVTTEKVFLIRKMTHATMRQSIYINYGEGRG